MATDRIRRGLLVAGGAAAIGAFAWWRPGTRGELLLAACDDRDGHHYLAGLDTDGELRFRIPVAERAHAIALLPDQRRAVFFARRPGTVSRVVDIETGELQATLTSPEGRHFYGHGAIDADGLLYTSENDYANARGVIGIWDVANGVQRTGEIDSAGTGPHELAFLRNGRTLVVANGGIETHPARPREKLNIPTMQPSLTYIDTTNGRVLEQYRPDDHLMSLRHLAVTPSDQVVVGVQYEGSVDAIVPLMLSHRGENRLQAGQAGAAEWRSHRNYIASVATSHDGRHAVLTAPRGATASLWNLSTLALETQWSVRDVAGAAGSADGGFLLTSGVGKVLHVPPGGLPTRQAAGKEHWDNHLLVT